MDMKISGSGTIATGEYEDIKISGSGKITGKILCKSLHCSGAAKADGDIECQNEIKASGAFKTTHNIKTRKLNVSGSCGIDGCVNAEEIVKISGSCRIDGTLSAGSVIVSGGFTAGKDIEAEEFYASGRVKCPGLLNAQKVEIKTNGSGINIGEIGGGTIIIEKTLNSEGSGIIRLPLFRKLASTSNLGNRIELIEGDNIAVEACHVGKIIGANVALGDGAEVDIVEYTESIEIHEKAKVGEYVKV